MIDFTWDVVVMMMLFGVFGIIIGYKIGEVLGEAAQTDKQYWLRNLWVFLGGILISAVISAIGLLTLGTLGIGMIAGAIAGLKAGYGKSVGLWNKHDRYFRVNRDQVAATESRDKASAEGMSDEERAARQVISVNNDAPGGSDARKHRR